MKKIFFGFMTLFALVAFTSFSTASEGTDANATKCGSDKPMKCGAGKCGTDTPTKCGAGKCGTDTPTKCGAGKCGGGK